VTDAAYRIEAVHRADSALNLTSVPHSWWTVGARLSGGVLESFGIQVPLIYPEQFVLFKAIRVDLQ
jgi:hypothetical protein